MQGKHVVIVLTAIVALGRVPAMPHQSNAGGPDDKDRAAIAQTLDRFRDAWNTHDAHAFALTQGQPPNRQNP
jgi:hypothetical protein